MRKGRKQLRAHRVLGRCGSKQEGCSYKHKSFMPMTHRRSNCSANSQMQPLLTAFWPTVAYHSCLKCSKLSANSNTHGSLHTWITSTACYHAELRDHISTFRTVIVEQVQELTGCHSWDVLSLRLQREGKDPSKHGQNTTDAVKQALEGKLFVTELCSPNNRDVSNPMHGFVDAPKALCSYG